MSVVAEQVQFFRNSRRDNLAITIRSKADSHRWIRISFVNFHVAYPFVDPPLTTIENCGVSIPAELEVTEWEACRFATFVHGWEDHSALTTFLSDYLQKVLQVPDSAESVSVTYA